MLRSVEVVEVYLPFLKGNGKYNKRDTQMPIRFYHMTEEEYDNLRKSMGQGVDGVEESEQRKRVLERETREDGSTK